MQTILKSKLFIAMASLLTVIAATVVISVNVNYSGDDLQVKLDLGNKYASELDYENAIIAYEEALEIDPYCLDAYLGLSGAYQALGQEDKAIAIMEQAKELLPENVDIYVSLAQLYTAQGQNNLAVSILEEGIKATGSDRLKDLLGEYRPEGMRTELAAGGTSSETPKIPAKEETPLEDDLVSVGIRQDERPVIVISREDEEMVKIPLVVPQPENNAGNQTENSGGNHTNGVGSGGSGNENNGSFPGDEDEGELPENGDEGELPGDGDEEELPGDGDGDEGELPGDGNEEELPGDEDEGELPGDEGEEELPGGGDEGELPGDGEDGNLPGDGDGDGGDDPGIVIPTPPRTGISGSVYGVNGQGLEGVTVTVYSGQDDVLASADTDTIGSYLQELAEGDYRIVLSKEGYVDLSTSVSVLTDALTSNAYIMLTEEESRQSASLKGVVISAVDSTAIEGATVALLEGFDNPSYRDPNAIAGSNHTTTGANGEFSMENGVTAGYYTVVTSKDNYSTYHHNETVKPGENEFQISMSPVIRNQGVYRIVLEWGSSPRDLDSHITSNGNDNYHVYYGNRSSENGKAVLDTDITSGYGPETITLEIGEGNSYIYSVHNYTNSGASQGSSDAWNLANSGAKVTVYGDEGIIFNGNVPTHEQGVTWEVFRIENGRLTVTNRVCFDHPSNLPQTTSAGRGIDKLATSAASEDGKEKVPTAMPENGVQVFKNQAPVTGNAETEETTMEETGEEPEDSGEPEGSKEPIGSKEPAEPEAGKPDDFEEAEEESEEAEKEETGNEGGNVDFVIENEEEKAEPEEADKEDIEETAEPEDITEEDTDGTEEPEETTESKEPENVGASVNREEALKPEEEIHMEDPAEAVDLNTSDHAAESEEAETLAEAAISSDADR